jgi:hypothetical protein
MLSIQPLAGNRDLRHFIDLPSTLFADRREWIAPLRIERRLHMGKHNPYFEHAEWQGWLAHKDGIAVGRISAQVDQVRLDRYQDATGYFGFLDAVDDIEVFRILLDTASAWLRERGITRVRGPFNFSSNHDCGLLVDGFDTPPVVMMPHGLPYYAGHIEALGYTRAQDLLAYRIDTDFEVPRGMQSLIDKSAGQIRLRPLDRGHKDRDFLILRDIFNDAWSENWEFTPFNEAEFRDIGQTLAPLIKDDYLQIAEIDGEPVGMIVLLPNLNELIRDLDGRLLPFGWLKLIWRLKRVGARSGRIPLMGIRKQWQSSLLGTAMVYQLIGALREPALREGMREVEMSWILESNQPMCRVIESLGGVAYKRYRIYERQLDHD